MQIPVQPETVEIIAQIIMKGDVAPGLPRTVAPQDMHGLADPAVQSARARRLPQSPGVGHEQSEQRHRIGAAPFAQRPGAIPADRSAQRQTHQRAPVAQMHDAGRAVGASAQQTDGAVWQMRFERSGYKACIDTIDNSLKTPRNQPCDQAAVGQDSAARLHQMAAAQGGLYVHTPP